MPLYDYRWATGHNVTLNSLVNVETDLASFATPGPLVVARSQPVNPFGEITTSLDGVVVRDGQTTHEWLIDVLSAAGVKYIEDTYMSTNESTAITIYTRRHNREAYQRYNAFLTPFEFGQEPVYDRGRFRNILLSFTNLTVPA